nr:MAG TPA: ATP-dependent DNA helicase [Caudoviricetes sp.]
MVRGDMECLHEVEAEICRWEDILYSDYSRYLRREIDIYPIVDLH